MAASKIWAIDLGRSAIKGILMAPSKHGVEILDAGIIPLPPPPSRSPKVPSRDGRIWKGIAEFERRYRVNRQGAAIAIPSVNTLVREVEITLLARRNLSELIRYEASNAIPYVLDEAIWDYHIFGRAREPGSQLKGLIFAAKKTAVNNYLQAFSNAGIDKIYDVVLAPMGLLGLLRYETADRGGATLGIDIGAESCSVVGLWEDAFWMRDFEGGGASVTDLLMEEFEVDHKHAEKAKKNLASSPAGREMMGTVKPAVNKITRDLARNLEYVERSGRRLSFDRLYLLGGSRRLPGIKERIQKMLKKKTSALKDLGKISLSSRVDQRLVSGNIDRLAVALGTGLKAVGATPYEFSLVPETTARSARMSDRKKLTGAVALWALLLLGMVFYFAHSLNSRLLEGVETAEEANMLYVENRGKMESAAHKHLEEELKWMLSISEGRAQAVELAAGVCEVFERANEDENINSRFALKNFRIKRRDDTEGPEGSALIRGYVRGMVGGETESESEALTELNSAVLDPLKELATCRMERWNYTERSFQLEITGPAHGVADYNK